MSGRGGNSRRRSWKYRESVNRKEEDRNFSRENGWGSCGGGGNAPPAKGGKKNAASPRNRETVPAQKIGTAGRGSVVGKAEPFFDRPRWAPPQLPAEPIPVPNCPLCGKPIRDISAAITDRLSGVPVHFDCAITRIAEGENLEAGDTITYIGGGRFGVLHFPNPPDTRNFTIKKIFELEDKDSRADWRKNISDHYSVV
ncbi:MAG: hypothetical protein LBR93_11905 [Treponema sp.]|nr:hypothetical protein [Treponema sp.]